MNGDRVEITGPRPLRWRCRVPGDKGMSHRALLFGVLAAGDTALTGLAPGDDVARTQDALIALGAPISGDVGRLVVSGSGVEGLHASSGAIDCGNSGTTMRMLAGLVAGRPFRTVLTGDESLSRRPMARIVSPLRAMGTDIDAEAGERAPLTIHGRRLTGRRLVLEQASGQVKTALTLAGLQADGTTEIIEPAPSRDHTERMLGALGAPVRRVDERTLVVTRGQPRPFDLELPGDPSSAAFLIVAAVITPASDLVIDDLLLNPGRLEFVDALRRMGADIAVDEGDVRLGEPVGSITVRSSALHGTTVVCREAIIDEVPALAVAAACADGTTEFRDGAELRVKESDRVASVVDLLTALGIGAEARADGLVVRGGTPRPGTFDTHGDHRIALAAAVAANATTGRSTINGWSAVAVSYPAFLTDLDAIVGGG